MVLQMTNPAKIVVSASVVLGFLLACPQAYAMRILGSCIYLDDRPILTGHGADNGYAAPGTVWRNLTSHPLVPCRDFAVPVQSDRPLEAILKGKIRVGVSYGGSDVDTTELKLIRKTRYSIEWFLDPEWVEKYGPPAVVEPNSAELESPGISGSFLPSIGILSGILCLATTITLWRRARKSVRVRGEC